ncbi:NUDIX domain-containing protein [Rhodococcoides kyotonense]|uniref:Predicted NTP pyrophosphohydrolase, NUDIX family n=1 Tax=Rhodococcoides kyotonense TaxID=398843 RepID=A0A239FJ88_9NOCA|nr:NUDIX domain-containing protein [Rhodococcus kyotonensis]SNS56821.1 Predicted NTP pyrophosphohydrolase, NUDIX family [Rhodococcus kyotonensis]
MPKTSAGLLPFRRRGGVVEVLIAHPGGPFWARKDAGAWSVIKGEYTDEDPMTAAVREFREETGFDVVGDPFLLGVVTQKGGKVVTVFAVDADFDASAAVGNTFEMEWPPKSGKTQSFPEIDRIEWFGLADARVKLLEAQVVLLDALE